jgi:hypothetical protein
MMTVKEVLRTVIRCFESGDIPQTIAYSFFPAHDLPSAKWSLLNRMLVFMSGTADARGYGQWLEVNRYVKKGARAIYILVPRFVRSENEDGETEEKLKGFLPKPVFRVEDTEGQPLSYQQQLEPSKLPLIAKAHEWGISVKAVPGNRHYYGYFSKSRMEIGLASKEETVFFHELAHGALQRIGKSQGLEEWKEEIVAELAAAVLCKMVGKTSRFLGNNFRYISHYAKKTSVSPLRACLDVMSDVEKVLDLILSERGAITGCTGNLPGKDVDVGEPRQAVAAPLRQEKPGAHPSLQLTSFCKFNGTSGHPVTCDRLP